MKYIFELTYFNISALLVVINPHRMLLQITNLMRGTMTTVLNGPPAHFTYSKSGCYYKRNSATYNERIYFQLIQLNVISSMSSYNSFALFKRFITFRSIFLFYTPWKHYESSGFLMFSWVVERKHWPVKPIFHKCSYVKSIQLQSFFWSVFSCIWTP